MTPLTDPNNVMWVVETPAPDAPEETVASVKRRPKMAAYTSLLASLTAATDPNFKETTVKRDSKGRFAKKAGVKSAASPPPSPPQQSQQLQDSEEILNVYLLEQGASTSAEADQYYNQMYDLRAAYQANYGVAWTPNAHTALEEAYEAEVEAYQAALSTATPATKKATSAAPAKKAAAPTPASTTGKKMTNKVIYGKHANGTIIQSTDGQHRMIYNATGNNWTVQERTPDGGWTTTDILGKGAAYKKANELSTTFRCEHLSTHPAAQALP